MASPGPSPAQPASSEKPQSPHAPPPAKRSIAWPVAFAVVAIVALLVAGALAYKLLNIPKEIIDKGTLQITEAFRPRVTVSKVVQAFVGEIKKDPKLVVMTATITADVKYEEDVRILWEKLSLGKNVVRIRAFENKVQYIIPLKDFSEKSFRTDFAKRELIATVPPPVVDEDMVSVQSDPGKIEVETKTGWGRMSSSAKVLEQEARTDLKPAVVAQANNALYREETRREGEKTLRRILSVFKGMLKEGWTLRVEFK
jgi:hypothetical protein